MAIGMNAPVNSTRQKAAGKSSRLSKVWKTAPGYAIAIVCLVWVFHDVRIGEFMSSIATINWWWVAGAVFFDILSYISQGMRWSLLLHPIGRISTFRATQAIYAGLFINEILPMRLGEVLRTYLVSRWAQARFAAVIPSILVERFFDAIWLALAFGITVFIVPLPKYLVDAEEILGFAALAAAILFIYLVFHRKRDVAGSPERIRRYWRPLGWISSLLDKMAGGVRDIGQSRFFYSSFGISLLLLLGQILSYWFVMQAYGLGLSFWHGAAVFLILHIGTVIPSAPSNVGTYQFFTVVGLTLFGINKTLATSFSVVVFLILTIPLWVIGLLAFTRLGLSLKKIRTEISSLAKSGFSSEAD
jgi:glycosyltransferase 2 family protein